MYFDIICSINQLVGNSPWKKSNSASKSIFSLIRNYSERSDKVEMLVSFYTNKWLLQLWTWEEFCVGSDITIVNVPGCCEWVIWKVCMSFKYLYLLFVIHVNWHFILFWALFGNFAGIPHCLGHQARVAPQTGECAKGAAGSEEQSWRIFGPRLCPTPANY